MLSSPNGFGLIKPMIYFIISVLAASILNIGTNDAFILSIVGYEVSEVNGRFGDKHQHTKHFDSMKLMR
jgi:flavin reductase (DIM6/NTAB) family NADH-FMN oxidoreductase RutF